MNVKIKQEFAETASDISEARGWWKGENSLYKNRLKLVEECGELAVAISDENATKENAYKILHRKFVMSRFDELVKDTIQDEIADIWIKGVDILKRLDMSLLPCESSEYVVGLNIERIESSEEFVLELSQLCGRDVSFIPAMLLFIEAWCIKSGVDLEWHVENKMIYNRYRK